MATPVPAAIRIVHSKTFPEFEIDDGKEPFGMPFTNRELAVIVANELNRHDPVMWLYKVERHVDDRRWIIVRVGRESHLSRIAGRTAA